MEGHLKSYDPEAGLGTFLDENIQSLADLTRLVRGELSGLHRRILAALITIDVHARDIVMDLVKRKICDLNEFAWQMQLRYYLEGDDVVVRQVRLACKLQCALLALRFACIAVCCAVHDLHIPGDSNPRPFHPLQLIP